MPAIALPPSCTPLGLIIIPSPNSTWIYTAVDPSGAGIAPHAENKARDPELQQEALFRQHCERNCPWPGVWNNAGLWSAGVIHVPAPLRWSRVVTNPPLPESGGSSSPPPPGSKPTLLLQHGEVGDKSVKIAAGLKILKENWFGSSGIG